MIFATVIFLHLREEYVHLNEFLCHGPADIFEESTAILWILHEVVFDEVALDVHDDMDGFGIFMICLYCGDTSSIRPEIAILSKKICRFFDRRDDISADAYLGSSIDDHEHVTIIRWSFGDEGVVIWNILYRDSTLSIFAKRLNLFGRESEVAEHLRLV